MALGGTVALRLLRRTALILVIALLPMAVVVPSSMAARAQASCSPVLFLGAHGVGEGGAAGTTPDEGHWGKPVQAVWDQFNANGVDAVAEAVSYPQVPAPTNLNSPVQLGSFLVHLARSSYYGNDSLKNDMTNTYSDCPNTLFVLAGYSQGAWVIDYVLHLFNSEKGLGGQVPLGKKILANVRGVFLMGDPAWPTSTQTPNLEGVVTRDASWVTPVLPNSVYPTGQAYLDNGLPLSDFWSICAGGDPICHYDGSIADLNANVNTHKTAYTNGSPSVADDGGNWLATRIGGSAG